MDDSNNESNNLEKKDSLVLEKLNLDYNDEEIKENEMKSKENFDERMNFLFNKLESQLNNVKKYVNSNLPMNDLNLDLSPYKINNNTNNNYNDYGIYNNENLIEIKSEDNFGNDGENDNIKFKQVNYGQKKNINRDNNKNIDTIEVEENKDNNEPENNNINNMGNINNINNSNNINDIKNENDIKINEYNFASNIDDNENELLASIASKNLIEGMEELDKIKNSTNLYNNYQENLRKENELKKFEEEEKRIKKMEDELKRREELLLKNEEKLKKEKEKFEDEKKEENKRRKKEEEDYKRQREEEEEEERKKKEEEEEEERRRKEEEEEENKRRKEQEEEELGDKLLNEEENRLLKEEKEKEEEERRENERIKNERIMKEQKEKEEEERRKKEEEKQKELERKKKEEELQQEKELKEQMKNQKQNIEEDDEVKIEEVDDIEELEEEVSYTETSNVRSRIKQSVITKSVVPQKNKNSINESLNNKQVFKSQMPKKNSLNPISSINSNQSEIEESKNENVNNSKNKGANKNINNKSNNKLNQSKNLKNSGLQKSQMKKSANQNNNNVKKPKSQKQPENEIKEDKNIKDSKISSPASKKFLKSSIYNKLNKGMRDKILEYINEVENFDIKHPNLDDLNTFPYISQFDEDDEKSLSEIIPNFKEKILDNIKKENKQKNSLNEDSQEKEQKVEQLIIDVANIPNETHMDIMKKNLEKENLKNLPKIEEEELKDLDTLEQKLFSDEEFLQEFNSPFSKLENLQTFIYKYSAHENHKLMGNSIINFNNWRMTLGDGNSFYRVVMFALIENCIIESNVNLLKPILNEMTSDKFIENYKKKDLNYEKPFTILSAILMMIENGMEQKAYEYFLKAYQIKNGCFDLLLIIYLKYAMYNFAEEINKLLDEKKKTSEDKEIIEKAKMNLDEIDSLYSEPKLYLLNLIIFLFDVNIILCMVDGKFLEPEDNIKKIVIDEDTSLPTFIFGYFFSSYHILYPPNINNGILSNIENEDNPKITQLTYILKDNKKCDMCFEETEKIVFLRKKFVICEPCLKRKINEIINNRKKAFFEEKCYGKEYYSRKIHLQGDFYIDDYEFIEIFEEINISNALYIKEKKCLKCKKEESEELNLTKLKCGCTYCEECLGKIIYKLSNGYGFLLECEYDMFGQDFKCNCKKNYTYKDFADLIEKDEEELDNAKKRMIKYIQNNCMICLKDLIKEKDIKKIKMRKGTGLLDHFMCIQCYKKYIKMSKPDSDDEEEENENEEDTKDMVKDSKIKKDNLKDKKILNKEENKINCSICNAWHQYTEDEGNCKCIIY